MHVSCMYAKITHHQQCMLSCPICCSCQSLVWAVLAVTICGTVPGATSMQYSTNLVLEQSSGLLLDVGPTIIPFLYVTTTCTHKPHATRNFKSIQLTVTITIFLKHKVGKHQHSYCCTRSSGALWQMRKVKCSISYLYNTHGQTIY